MRDGSAMQSSGARALVSRRAGLVRLRWVRGVVALALCVLVVGVGVWLLVAWVPGGVARPAAWWIVGFRIAFVVPPVLLLALTWALLDTVPSRLRPGMIVTTGGLALWMGYEVAVAWGGAPLGGGMTDLFIGGIVVVGLTMHLVAGLRQDRHMRLVAESDPLTGLLNRAGAQRVWEGLSASQSVSVAMVDLNELKSLNDAVGHSEGDRLIVACAGALSRACTSRGWVARWGGDEFVVVLPGLGEHDARSLLGAAGATVAPAAKDLPVWAAGVTSTQGGGLLREALRVADGRMYRQKAMQYRLRARPGRAATGVSRRGAGADSTDVPGSGSGL